jgi:hypothetical protein
MGTLSPRRHARPSAGHDEPEKLPNEDELTRFLIQLSNSLLQTRVRDPAAKSPESCIKLSPNRGRRECRALDAPAASYARIESIRVSHHGHTGNARHSPRNGFNGFLRALPGEPGLLSPSPARCASIVAELTPASGRQDHTTSPSARFALSSVAQLASTASRLDVRDDREPPLL